MDIKVDALQIDEIELNEEEKSKIYVIKVSYSDLKNLCRLGNIAINRELDEDRALEMVDYINSKSSFYPTLVVSTVKKDNIDYQETEKSMVITIKKDEDKFIVLDGQHRFQSINLISDEELKKERYQSILLVENINDFKQRKLFMDINNTPRKVKTGTKCRFEKTISNYISLKLINNRESALKYITMDENQTKDNNKIPYKYIVKFNEKFINLLEKGFKQEKYKLENIDKVMTEVLEVNKLLLDLIEFSQISDINVTTYEVMYSCLGVILSEYVVETSNNNVQIRMEDIRYVLKILKEKLKDISTEFTQSIPKSQSERKSKLDMIVRRILQ